MAVEKTKHQFVDDNPYLVYSGEPESTVDSAGGGGGDDSPFLYVTVSEDLSTWTESGIQLTIDVNKETIVNAIQAGKPVIFVVNLTDQRSVIRHLVKANIYVQDFSTVYASFYTPLTSSGTPAINFYLIVINNYVAMGQKILQD